MKAAKEYIVFPLDVPDPDEARRLVSLLANEVGMFKVGLELFIRSGPELVRWIVEAGSAKVFLDLKLHDIPMTVKRAMARAAELGVFFATVLTSISAEDISQAGYRQAYADDLRQLVMKKAAMAKDAGCAGIVCSGEEVQAVKDAFGTDFQAVTPGIRPAGRGVAADDQARVVTPATAIRRGADYLVIGRPIRDADDPAMAAREIAAEIGTVLGG